MTNRRIITENTASALLFIAFSILIIMLRRIDTAAIGPEGTVIGLSHINGAVRDAIGYSSIWYTISEIAGYLSFIPMLACALYGLYELISRKSLRAVDGEIYLAAVLYIAVIAVYVFFNAVVINYRPLLENGTIEASFPSSHTLLAMTSCGSMIILSGIIVKSIAIQKALNAALAVLMALTVISRLLSGVHWITDIIGAILLSSSLLLLFDSLICQIGSEKTKA